MCICCNVWVQALTRAHAHTFSAIIGNEQQQYLTSLTLFLMWYWRCDFNPLFNHLTIKSLPYWSAKGLLLLQKVVWFWSFFGKYWYTFNSITPAEIWHIPILCHSKILSHLRFLNEILELQLCIYFWLPGWEVSRRVLWLSHL